MGGRAPLALIDAAAASRMAIGEAITNLAGAPIDHLQQIHLSANWMAAAAHPGELVQLFDAVKAAGLELCPQLGINIPVGKDSLSMQMRWQDKTVVSPVSLVVTAVAPVSDVRRHVTPQLHCDQGDSQLLLIDLGQGRQRLGGSALAQVMGQLGHQCPDVDDPQLIKGFFAALQQLLSAGLLLAYHDRSDGGLLTTVLEMAFAGHCGITLTLPDSALHHPLAWLFNEELGAVIQVKTTDLAAVETLLQAQGLMPCCQRIGQPNRSDDIRIEQPHGSSLWCASRIHCQRQWSETSYRMQALRDNPDCAQQEYDNLIEPNDPGLSTRLTYALPQYPYPCSKDQRPKVAILREQGVNGHTEMAAAFVQAGFDAIDVHMTDILCQREDLSRFRGLVACGGFSYGDVLGAGQGWAKSILYHAQARAIFSRFFQRSDTFTLGVCNGCQMLTALRDIIPGSAHWPEFSVNQSEQFEARTVMVKVHACQSILLKGMADSWLPVAVAHGQGQAVLQQPNDSQLLQQQGQLALSYIDNHGTITQRYPFNPNGSTLGITGVCTTDGRVTLMMPHPERVVRSVNHTWSPTQGTQMAGSWFELFVNARRWCDNTPSVS